MEQDTLKVSEIFYSIQGEGEFVGTPAVFIRFFGCNLNCPWCDTKYAVNEGKYANLKIEEISQRVFDLLPGHIGVRHIVLTGGEPFLQDWESVKKLMKDLNQEWRFLFEIETNGTICPQSIPDVVPVFITCSPKRGTKLSKMIEVADAIKVVVSEKKDLQFAEDFESLPKMPKLFLQPESNRKEAMELCLNYIKENPWWRLSLQTQKLIQIR